MDIRQRQLTLAPRLLSISAKIGLASSPSDVCTSTYATTPLKQFAPVVECMMAASDLSAGWSESAMDTSPEATDCRGRWTEDSLEELARAVAGVEAEVAEVLGIPRPIDIEGRGRVGSDPAGFAFFTFSLFNASESPAMDLDVSRDNPSLREVDAVSEENADTFLAGSETDRGEPLPLGMFDSCLDVPSEPSCCGYNVGPETSRSRGRARGPEPREEGYDGLRLTRPGSVD